MTEARSGRQLAKALGKSESAVRKWLANPSWPFGKTGPWDVARVRNWARGLSPNPAATEDFSAKPLTVERKAKLSLTRERRRLLKFQREVQQGMYVLRSHVEAGRLSRVEAVKASLFGIPRLAPQLVGMAEAEIATVLEAEVIKILNGFARPEPTGAEKS